MPDHAGGSRHARVVSVSRGVFTDVVGPTPRCLEALAVDDPRARLVILVLGDPHLLEGGQRGEDGPANPDRVLTLRRRHNFNLDSGWGKCRDLLVQALVDVGEHRGTTG